MKPIYKVISRTLNSRSRYTPIQVMDLVRTADRKKTPYSHIRVSINLVYGTVDVETGSDDGLIIRPFSLRSIRVSQP